MSIFQPFMATKPNENEWIINITKSFSQGLEDDVETPVTIFNVPKALMATDPISYAPQRIAIGPYHYWRPELYEMEKYKINASKRFSKHLIDESHKFQDLVGELKLRVPLIRAAYDKYLSINDDTLAWMVAMDACFLLEFLHVYAVKEGKVLASVPTKMSHMVDVLGRKSAHNVMLRDIVMLENQIPLFVLRKVLEWEFSSPDLADDMLFAMLTGLCKDLSPFENMVDEELAKIRAQLDDCAHLLDFLYQAIVPDLDVSCQEVTQDLEEQSGEHDGDDQANSLGDSSILRRLVQEIWKSLSQVQSAPVRVLKVIVNLPWDIINTIPGIKKLKRPFERLFPTTQESKKTDDDGDGDDSSERPPLIEEISIPSVYELAKLGVRFSHTKSNIRGIAFDSKTTTLHLPKIRLDVNSQVVLRNMVAYESCIACRPLVLARYTELMNGIIDSEKDSMVLREKGILLNHLKSDEEVANLWNGMSKSIRLTKVPLLDKAIEDVNKYCDGKWKVKVVKFMKSYIYSSWKILILMATIFLLLLLSLQSFCDVYSCPRLFNIDSTH